MLSPTRAAAALVFLFCVPLHAGFPGKELILPAVGRVDGAGGSHFYTTVWVTNPSAADRADLQIEFLVAGQANANPASVTDSLAPGQTKVYENIAETMFGIKGVLGAARFRSSSDIVVSARIYNQPDGTGAADSNGEFFSAVPPDFGITSGDSALLQGLRQTADFRYNLIFVETSGNAASGHLRITDANGVELANAPITLQPFEERLVGLGTFLPQGAVLADGALTLSLDSGNGRVVMAGSLLANQSQNAAGFEMAFRSSLLASNGSSITGITAGAGLTGGGTSGDVTLGIANGGVVGTMIADRTVVRAINGASDFVTIAGGTNINVAQSGQTITITNTAPAPNTSLSGDVTGTQSATVVSTVGGVSAASVASGANAANAATSANTAGTIVKRDGSGNFAAGTITATLNGNATTATSFSGALAGDVTGTQSATLVSAVGGQSAANVASATAAANAATNANTPSTIVKRDASGNFTAGTITAALNGNATTATTSGTATNFSGALAGDVTGTQSATVVSTVGGTSAANVASGATAANSATNANSASTIVKRDASGNFAAGTITATLNGNAASATTANTANTATTANSATNFTGSLSGDVTGTQGATVVGSVGGQTAASIASATTAANNATNANTPSTIVMRDASGNFSAGTITANLAGSATTATSVTGLVGMANGGTGLAASGTAGNFLRSNGSAWTSNTIQPSDLPAGSTNYIQNGTSQQASSNFNVSGNGTAGGTLSAGIVAATTSYSLSGSTFLANAGDTTNSFVGVNAGIATVPGASPAGEFNTFLGFLAGSGNTAGYSNTFLGQRCGVNGTTGHDNTAVGVNAALHANGGFNTYLGEAAGANDTSGNFNTMLGVSADAAASGLTFATAVGSGTTVSTSNTIVLGRSDGSDTVKIPGSLTVTGAINGSATNFTGSLAGDVTGTQSATVVGKVGGQTSANVASATTAANSATNANTASTIVKRDGSGNFSAGTITANLAGTATNFSGSLAGDVTGTQGATVVAKVGGQTAANVASATTAANAATSTNTGSTIVKRDGSGNFSAGTITATLAGAATSFSGSLAGDVTGTQSATVVGSVGGQTAANVAAATTAANAATNANTVSTIVKRDGSGNFSAGTITATLAGTATSFSGSLSGDVTGTQAATVVSAVGGQSAANVASGTAAANGATNANTPNTIVKRDASGNFIATNVSGLVGVGNGGTGITASGTSGNYLRSTGAAWASSAIQAGDIPAGSGNYIQNTSTQQTANFNISGLGTASNFNAAAYQLGGSAFLGDLGDTSNVILGIAAGVNDAPSGALGTSNTFVGGGAGHSNVSGSSITAVGNFAGSAASANNGTFIGALSGFHTTSGSDDTFVGVNAGTTNGLGDHNTALGSGADMSGGSLTYATAIGAGAVVSNSSSVVLGRSSDTVRIPGNLIVTGSVSKGSGSFRIDHPLDPQNKYLYHSFVESPDMMNVYNGNIVTDGNGVAVVELPDYFEALNRDFRYQLTVIGEFAQAIVAKKIANNRFTIRTDKPNIEVSWQVTGIRQDRYAEDHRIVPEVEKPPTERGHCAYAPACGN